MGTGTRTGVPAPGARWQRGQWGSVSPNPGHGAGGWHPGVARGGFKGQSGPCPLCQASPSPRPLRALRPRLPPQGTGRHSCPSLGTAEPPPSWGWRGTGWSPGWGGARTLRDPRGWVLGGPCAMPPSRVSPNPVTGCRAWGHRGCQRALLSSVTQFPSVPSSAGHLLGARAPGGVGTPRSLGLHPQGTLAPPGWGGARGCAELARDYTKPEVPGPPELAPRGHPEATVTGTKGSIWGHQSCQRRDKLGPQGLAPKGQSGDTGTSTEGIT